MKIVLFGGSGFIGKHVIKHFSEKQHQVILVSRKQLDRLPSNMENITWDELESDITLLEMSDAFINLSGETINQRWTSTAKDKILRSRIHTVSSIKGMIHKLENPPKVLLNASAIGIYGTSDKKMFTEFSHRNNDDFLSNVVRMWEKQLDEIQHTRVIKMRFGVVLGRDGGALQQMKNPYQFGIGGKIGSGKQWVSWIHIEDVMKIMAYCLNNEKVEGPINVTSPYPVTNEEFGKAIGKALHRPHWFAVPSWVMKLVFGEMSVLILQGQRVIPQKLLDYHFEYNFETIDAALDNLLAK